MTWQAMDIVRHVIQRALNPRLLSRMTPYDVASNPRQTLNPKP